MSFFRKVFRWLSRGCTRGLEHGKTASSGTSLAWPCIIGGSRPLTPQGGLAPPRQHGQSPQPPPICQGVSPDRRAALRSETRGGPLDPRVYYPTPAIFFRVLLILFLLINMVKRSREADSNVVAVVKRTKLTRSPRMSSGELALKKVNKLIRDEESKIFDYTPGEFPVDDAGIVFPISDITQGIAFNERIGDVVNPTKLELRYRVKDVASTGVNGRYIRTIVMQSRQRFIPVFDNSGGNGILEATITTADAPLSAYQHDNRNHFTVLYDKTHTLCTNCDTEIVVKNINLFPKRKVKFEDPSPTAVEEGRIWVCFVSSASTSDLVTNFYSRMFYKDT